MMVLREEIRKIWNGKIVFMLILMGVLYFYLFMSFNVRYFPNGHPALEQYQLMSDWKKLYGDTMDDRERADAERRFKEQFAIAAEVSVEDLLEGSDLVEEEKAGKEGIEYWNQWVSALYDYDIRNERLKEAMDAAPTPAMQKRIREITEKDEMTAVLPYEIMGNTIEYWRWGASFILFSILILLAPAVAKDRMTGVQTLQYSSKVGRKITKIQLLAMLLSALFLFLLEVAVMEGIYAQNQTWRFWGTSIMRCFGYEQLYWYNMSYGGYFLCILFLTLLYAICILGFTFLFSAHSKSYTSLLLKMVPVYGCLAVFLLHLSLCDLFDLNNTVSSFTGIPGSELWLALGLAALGVVLIAVSFRVKKS